MSLLHKFFLVEKEWYYSQFRSSKDSIQIHLELEKCENFGKDIKDVVEIHDDLIRYMYDTLKWIPIQNITVDSDFFINLYGITMIDKKNALWIKKIFKAWSDLFAHAPENFELTGNYYTIEETGEEGYETIKINRSELINTLNKITSFAEKVTKGDMLILHNGL